MAQYGDLIESSGPYEKDALFELFVNFYGNPDMTKMKDAGAYSMYMAKIHCMLSTQRRYLMVFVQKDNVSIGNTQPLVNLKWVSFQTRTSEDNHNLKPIHYMPVRGTKMDAEIKLLKRDGKTTTYSVNRFPLIVTLLHPPKMARSYQDTGSLLTALETFQTVITHLS
jgi:hypothetical protein